MLESLVTWVLNNYLGKYVENLNTDQLSIAILSGEVELENLPLRRDALRHLGIPIEIRSGLIGKIKLQIPIRSLRSSPWLLVIERLYLVAVPLALEEWDQAAEEVAAFDRKLAALDAVEACWRIEADGNAVNSPYASSYSSWLNFGAGVITDILENIQLQIKDVHLRYEDAISLRKGTACVCGITIESLTSQSCDQNWQPQFTTHRDGFDLSFKTIELKKLAIYWDSINPDTELTSKLSVTDLTATLSNDCVTKHQYLVAPVSACAKVTRNRNEQPLKSVQKPRFVCNLNLDPVPLVLIEWQYEQMFCCIRGLKFISRIQEYRQHRPKQSISTNPKAWWFYACHCQIPGFRRFLSWSEMLEKARENVQYVEIYTKWLAQPTAALNPKSKILKDNVEWSRNIDILKSLREVAMRRVPVALRKVDGSENSVQGQSVLVRWFPQWWKWYSTPTTQNENATVQVQTEISSKSNSSDNKLEDEILEVLTDSAHNNTLFRRDVVFGKFNFTLSEGTLELRSSKEIGTQGSTMLEMQFSVLELGIESRPRSSAFGVELRLGTVQLRDCLTPSSLFPILVGPSSHHQQQHFNLRLNKQLNDSSTTPAEPLFILTYNWTSSPAVHRLHVTSRPLYVVYQPEAVKWLLEFICAPHQRTTTRDRLQAMRYQLTNTWGSMLDSRRFEQSRTPTWNLRLHISAPQLIVVENFSDPYSAIAVIDLGTLHLHNEPFNNFAKVHNDSTTNFQVLPTNIASPTAEEANDDEDEMFMTPCSTPPGSETGVEDDTATLTTALSEFTLHQRLYDIYTIELADIQLLVSRVRDNWRQAHTKGSSNLHVLDRFNITMQIEHRIVPTNDPMYPSITISALLTRLVGHINEQKIIAIRTLVSVISNMTLPSPFNNANNEMPNISEACQSQTIQEDKSASILNDKKKNEDDKDDILRQLLTLQFTIEQMSLELQSRGRSVAELQVSGVAVSLTYRPSDVSLQLTVHGLLLVDALQTFGGDFELLVASHRHVVMDSMSGSLRDSEPTSPTSPASPDPSGPRQHLLSGATSPIALTKALNAMTTTSPLPTQSHHNEALISIEYLKVINTEENLQVITVQFNNLDIIANQETIVELFGFVRRVSPNSTRVMPTLKPKILNDQSTSSLLENGLDQSKSEYVSKSRIELTFDFHRLSVLLLRASGNTGRKIGTATMCEARIQSTIDSSLFIRGSLGGLQVVDLTPENYHHQRIISVGRDALVHDESFSDFFIDEHTYNDTALNFNILYKLQHNVDEPVAEVSIKMASVWYTHIPQFLFELQSCATEFKQYLADAARSLRTAATDVALGLVHARVVEQLQHGIYSPRRLRRRTSSTSIESRTPYTPLIAEEDGYESDDLFDIRDVKLNVVLDSPVVVMPRSNTSFQVLIGHLGKITINNNQERSTFEIEVRDMNLSTLDTIFSRQNKLSTCIPRVEQLYNCEKAIPILHDTLLRLQMKMDSQIEGEVSEVDYDNLHRSSLNITGSVVNNLKVSLTRVQYEQLLDTLQNSTTQPQQQQTYILPEIPEEDVQQLAGGISTLSIDPYVRAKLFPSATQRQRNAIDSGLQQEESIMKINFQFEVASFNVELCGINDESLIGLSFCDFLLKYNKWTKFESQIEVSLRSLLVQDLLQETGTQSRQMIVSRDEDKSFETMPPFVSHSCPLEFRTCNFTSNKLRQYGSLPDRLDAKLIFGVGKTSSTKKPFTKSVRKVQKEQLVSILSRIETNKKITTIELGTLDVTVSAKSWLPLLQFFSYVDDSASQQIIITEQSHNINEEKTSSITTTTIKSLTLKALDNNNKNFARARVIGIEVNSYRELHKNKRICGHLDVIHITDDDIQHACRGERFVTIGDQALNFQYDCPPSKQYSSESDASPDSELRIEVSPFVYVHTKKFIAQLKSFFASFSQSELPTNPNKSMSYKVEEPSRMALKLSANACIMLVPIKSNSSDLLVLNCDRISSQNYFINTEDVYLDVSTLQLHQLDMYAAKAKERDILTMDRIPEDALVFGDCIVMKLGQSLLTEKCLLELRIDRNLNPTDNHHKNGIADMTINCQLSTLEAFLKLEDYVLIRGVLSHNLGEDTEHIFPSSVTSFSKSDKWTLSSTRIELLDVKVHLDSLACINFVRSRLTVDNYSDLSQDIDLISRQILITDERTESTNVFNTLLQPSSRSSLIETSTVQAEIHTRRRSDKISYTILLNNMRLMAVADWWKVAWEFISTNYQTDDEKILKASIEPEVFFELKLNITESQIVVVEDTTNLNTNAVILQSTTLMTYKPEDKLTKPFSCSVNHLEVFSCHLGDEEATALSIVDPVTASIDIIKNSVLEIQLQELIVRVSYRDILMFTSILKSFRKQTVSVPTKITSTATNLKTLSSLGFSIEDCERALLNCDNKVDDAALWLIQNATPGDTAVATSSVKSNSLDYNTVTFHAACIRFCLIDDCGDVDVPLAEASFTDFLAVTESNNDGHSTTVETTVESAITIDYYNRVLGGWEPLVESWKCRGVWRPDYNVVNARHRLAIHSDKMFDVNITDSFLSLVRLVRETWTRDIGEPRITPRSPFIPYTLRNDTGSELSFDTVITDPDEPIRSLDEFELDETQLHWQKIEPGSTIPFSYSRDGHSKQRHQESHRLRSHQIAVRVKGWRACAPVTVDHVGVYFRSVAPQGPLITAPRPVRLVFDVRLDGSARKLVVVRSAMVLINKLPEPIDIKLVKRSTVNAVSTSNRSALLAAGQELPLPLIHTYSHIFVRPSSNVEYSYSQPDVPWARLQRPGERELFVLRCTTNRSTDYHICCEIRRERYPSTSTMGSNVSGHSILLLPVLLIVNLLPQDLHFKITLTTTNELVTQGTITSGKKASITATDPDVSVEIILFIDNFRCTSKLLIPDSSSPMEGEFNVRVRLEDAERRSLFLRARVEYAKGARMRVTVAAPYWIINRTGLPLIFKQAVNITGAEAAGQFAEHELARMVSPLLFSLADEELSALVARIGKRYKPGTDSQWCQQFHLRRGIQVRRLHVSPQDHSGPDTVYVIGIEIRPARGQRRHQYTKIITVSPRHQLHNRTNCTIEFAQACHASSVTDPGAAVFHVRAPPSCQVPFHWPRLDRDQLLCLRCLPNSEPPTAWTGGFRLDAPVSQHLLVRRCGTGERYCFLHAEIVPHGAMLCLVISEAEELPPPLRIDNCSEVAVTFSQGEVGSYITVAHAHRTVPYAWDEPTGVKKIMLTVPGGVSAVYDIDQLGRTSQLIYENFIYIAFIATFRTEDDLDHYNETEFMMLTHRTRKSSQADDNEMQDKDKSIQLQRLVLDVLEGSTAVILSRKQQGARNQLWRMTSIGQLQHEGSVDKGVPLVLDLEASAPQPNSAWPARLALRRPDPRRRSTQTWRFTSDGRLCCAHRNTCVQAVSLEPGSPAVLGCAPANATPPTALQAVGKQRMRPGSGLLSVEVTTDGPARVVRIMDMKQQPFSSRAICLASDEDWYGVAAVHRPQCQEPVTKHAELQITLMLRAGLSISVIGNSRELLYLQFNNIIAETVCGSKQHELCLSVQDIQCDNQLLESPAPVLLHGAKGRNVALNNSVQQQQLPILELRAEMSTPAGAVIIFKHFIVYMRSLAVHLEEILLLRLYEFLITALGQTIRVEEEDDEEDEDEENHNNDEQTITAAVPVSLKNSVTRYHFGIIRLVPGPLRLSVNTATTSVLTPRLRALKRRLGLTLVGFEDAPVELEPYVRHHPVETGARLRQSILNHFRDELLWQSAAILGSVDFLGNPLGLLEDVTEGVSGLIRERSVGALVLNVAHGLSNSAAKVTETLSDGLGRVTMDEAHEEMRQRLRRRHASSGPDHLVAGFKGLGFGILGGATGIFKQVYEGATTEGLQGVFSGLGKGLVGAVAKPVVGVLDLATETARAVRDSSRGTGRVVPERRRSPRATQGPGGLLPPYNIQDSIGQNYLRSLAIHTSVNRHHLDYFESSSDTGSCSNIERYVAYECVRSGNDDLRVIISSERIRVVTISSSTGSLTVVTETKLDELIACTPIGQSDGRYYIEMTVRGGQQLRRPLIRCDSEKIARDVTRQINYAKRLHEEASHTLRSYDD